MIGHRSLSVRLAAACVVASLGLSFAPAPASAGGGELCAEAAPDGNRWVCRLYQWFLHPPSSGESAFWIGILQQSGRVAVARELLGTFEVISEEVDDAYGEMLERLPDPAGAQFFINQMLSNGATAESVEAAIAGSAEFFAEAGGTTSGFVGRLYLAFLSRVPSLGESEFWAGQIEEEGMTRTQVALFFARSTERLQIPLQEFYALLDRAPDPGGAAFWTGVIAAQGRVVARQKFVVTDEVFEEIVFPV